MNDPEMMAAATVAFSKMNEDQRKEMQDQVARFTPEQIAQAQSMMNGMSAEQRAHMAEMAKKATPEELLQRSRQAATTPMPMPMPTSSASESESERLKAEGNALVRDKKYQEAVGKYTLALRTPGLGLETKKAAHLNASLCFLNLNRPDEAIKHASTVIKAIDASNMKAHYR
jgi:tetratricopeptide (TPR) repeat protein